MKTTLGTRTPRRARAGSALLYTMVIMTSLMMLSAAFYRVVARYDRATAASVDDKRAFYLAEAGLAEGMAALRAGGSGAVGSQANPAYLGGGLFWVTAADLGNSRTQLTVTAMAGSGRAALATVIRYEGEEPLFQTVLNSRDLLTMNADVVVDSYDSSLGDYASQAVNTTNGHTHANMNGDVASNVDIVMNARATIFGDATPGPGYNVIAAPDSYVSGSTVAAPEPFTFPPLTIPSIPSAGPLTVPTNGTRTIPPGDYGFDDLTINKSGRLTIQGPATLVVDNFVGGKDAFLEVDATNGPVTIHVQGNYTHTSGFQTLPSTGSPCAVAFMIQGSNDIVFPSNAIVRGGYYVPNANVTFASGSEVWGSFGANQIAMANGMKFHYDEYLTEYWEVDVSGNNDPIEMLVWQPTGIQPSMLLSKRTDPFDLLNVNRNFLLSPADSWDI